MTDPVRPLPPAARLAKAARRIRRRRGFLMTAILLIVGFVAVFVALNLIEFGRVD